MPNSRRAGYRRSRSRYAPKARFSRGYGAIYLKHIRQANEGCDFDFLESQDMSPAAGEPEIH